MKLSRLGIGFAALIAATAIAGAAGMFNNLPVVGASSTAYCALYAGDGTTCVGYVPAGPTVITGNELIPADTQIANGASPQTVRIKPASLGVGPYQYTAPLTGTSVTVAATSRRLIINPAGSITALTVVFPAASVLVDNQTFGLCSTQVVTGLTLTAGAGSTILNGPTALAVPPATGAGTCYEWVYRLANTSWFRVQ